MGCPSLLLGPGKAPRTPPNRAKIWPRIDHIFATVARIDKLIGYSERGRRTTSEYTIYLIKLARPKKSSELFEIFGKKILKTFFDFSKLFQNFQKFRNFRKYWKFSKFQKFWLFFQKYFPVDLEIFRMKCCGRFSITPLYIFRADTILSSSRSMEANGAAVVGLYREWKFCYISCHFASFCYILLHFAPSERLPKSWFRTH